MSFTAKYDSSVDVEVSAVAGTASPESDGAVRMAKIDCGSLTGYAPIMPDGSFDATLGNLKTSDGSQSVDLRPALSSGVTVTVSYTSMYGGTAETATMELPDVPVTDHLALKAESGGLHLIASDGFGDPDVDFYLYNAEETQNGSGEVLVEPPQYQPDGKGSFDADLSSSGLSVDDVLFYTLGKTDVEQTSSITMTFDRALSYIPAVITEDQPDPPAGTVGTVTLEVSNDPDTDPAMKLDPGTIIDCTLEQTNNRVLTLTPTSNLKAGVTYQLTLKNLVNDAGIAMAEDATITTRFTVHGGDIISNVHYGEVFDMVRRGVYLYIAAGKEGFDILDSSDPTDLHSAINGPVGTLGRARGVAIASGVSIPEGDKSNPRTVAVVTSGGSGGEAGRIELRYADEQGTDGQSAGMGEFISGALLCNSFGSGTNGGEPTVVKTMGTTAFVSTIGVGMQEVDLNKVAEKNTNAVMFTESSYQVPPSTWDIAMGIGGLGILPPSGENPGFVIGAVRHKGIVAWDVTGGQTGPQPAGMEAFPAGVSNTSGNMRLAVYPNYTYSKVVHGRPTTMTTDLMLVAGGWAGLLIYQLTPSSSSLGINLKTVVKLASSPYDVTVDEQRHIAYVACYDSGVAVVDLSDPYGGKLDADGNGTDDRIMGYLDINTYSRAAIVVDSETGLIFTGEGGEKSGVFAVGAQKPKLQFLLDDPQYPGRYQVPGYLSAFQGDQPRLGLWVPGGQGETVQATLQLYDRKGFEETRQVIGQNQDGSDILAPVSTVYRTVTLKRQSDIKTSNKYNFYIAPPDVVKLGMLYDAANPDPTLMVSKQSGSLKGEVYLSFANDPGSWCGTSTQSGGGWGSFVSVRTPVSRPWVEWKSDELVEDNSQGHTATNMAGVAGKAVTAKTSQLPLPVVYRGPRYLGNEQEREIHFDYKGEFLKYIYGGWYPVTLMFSSSSSQVQITPDSVANVGYMKDNITLKIKGTGETPESSDPIKITVSVRYNNGQTKAIYEIPIRIFKAGLAVDYNRDGQINFDASDRPTTEQPYYEFWVNNDHDVDDFDDASHVPDDLINGPADNTDYQIVSKRDLEDFTRLWVKKAPALHGDGSRIIYWMYFKKQDGNPTINLFKATDPNGGLSYLQNETAAQAQLSNGSVGDTHFAVQARPAQAVSEWRQLAVDGAPSSTAHYIFEGVTAGKGDLVMVLSLDGVLLARYKVPVQLRPITDFYEEYTVGNSTDDPGQPPASTPTPVRDSIAANSVQGSNYILFVHGWNMEGRLHKERWAETAYKRLWWLGYTGRFGLFRWPCRDMELMNWRLGYNESELNAWKSGTGLLSLLLSLKGKGYSVDVLVHSQGNVVMSEALREAKDGSVPKPLVNAYVATQAAISSSLFDSNAVDYFKTQGRNWTHVTPIDALGHFASQNPFGDLSAQPYMAGTKDYATYRINFFNKGDYAVGDYTSFLVGYDHQSAWEANNSNLRPWREPAQYPWQNADSYEYDAEHGSFKEVTTYPSGQFVKRTLDPAKRLDRFKILALAAQSYGRALGAGPSSDSHPHSYFQTNVDLQKKPFLFGQAHCEHDAEFMYDIQQRWPYWQQFLTDIGLQPAAPWSTQ